MQRKIIHMNHGILGSSDLDQMGKEYLERYKKQFKNPDIIESNLKHEELLACTPKQWAHVIKACTL